LEEASLVIGIPIMVILFFYKKRNDNGNHFLAFTLISMWYALFINRMNLSLQIVDYPYLIRTGNIAAYLVFPFLYLYTRKSFYPGIRLQIKDWLFFAPALFYVVDMMPFFLADPAYKIAVLKTNITDRVRMSNMSEGWVGIKGFHFVFRYLWSVFVMILQVRLIMKNWKPGQSEEQPWNRPFQLFIFTLTLMFVPLIVPGIFGVIFHMNWYTLVFINLNMSLVILATGLFILFSPRVLYGFYPLPMSMAPIEVVMKGSTKVARSVPPDPNVPSEPTIFMDDEETKAMVDRIKAFMYEKKPFLSNDYSIHDLGRDTQIPVYQLSPLINQHFSSNFRSWLNKYRVEHFLEITRHQGKSEFTLDALAQESGFGNRATFINAFKKEMGTTPGDYLKKRMASSLN
jgi:AraC-like DNA-binding protein